jgi:hypothetical protein
MGVSLYNFILVQKNKYLPLCGKNLSLYVFLKVTGLDK